MQTNGFGASNGPARNGFGGGAAKVGGFGGLPKEEDGWNKDAAAATPSFGAGKFSNGGGGRGGGFGGGRGELALWELAKPRLTETAI